MRYRNFVMDSIRWDALPVRSDDIIISTPAKCGTTWTQRLCSLLLSIEPTAERPLSVISPWLDMQTRAVTDVVADLEAQTHRRFIKTHTPLDGLPWSDDITYLVVARDPRDVAISWAHHLDNIDMDRFVTQRITAVGTDDLAELMPDGPPPPEPADPVDRFWAWSKGDGTSLGGLPGVVHHIGTAWALRDRSNVHLFHYSDMKADLPGVVRRMAAALGVALGDDDVQRIAAAATFDAMKTDADALVPNREHAFWRSDREFFHRGSSGQWQDLLSHDDLARYTAHVESLGDADFVRWLHEGGAVPEVRSSAPDG